ncbi:MAG TPA: MarR family transcriptional regulator [Acidimicrobiia bacterium]
MEKSASDKVRAWRALMHVHAAVTNAIDETLQAELGIPGTWYEALVEIAFAGGLMRMQEFAEETTLTKSGATRFVDRLERAGLVERKSCPTDRRVYQLTLTEEGKRLQEAADPHVLRVLEETFGRYISEDEAGVILNALRRAHMALAGVEPAAI